MYEQLEGSSVAPLRARLIGTSGAIEHLREQIRFAASNSQPVLLLGETGSGKGVCARLIHELGLRSTRRFVPYHPNFGGGDLVQSELFGHVRGAFTGATEGRRGLVLEAHGGTLFLDELDEVPADTQVRLLDLVQERRFRPVGADDFQTVDCRVVAASNRPLQELQVSGKLRRDLYHRIAHCVIEIPPLRSRVEDIPELARVALSECRRRSDVAVFDIEPDVYAILVTHAWPGNVRELQAVIEGAAYRAQFKGATVIDRTHIDLGSPGPGTKEQVRGVSLVEQVETFKLALVREALTRHGGNQVHAARELGIDRGTLKRIVDRSSS